MTLENDSNSGTIKLLNFMKNTLIFIILKTF